MTSNLGRAAVLLGLAACSVGAVSGISGGARNSDHAQRWARAMAYVFLGAMTVALGLMEYALLAHDFSVSYVAEVGSRETPTWVTIVSLWSSLDGSILLWAFVLSVYIAVFAWRTRGRYVRYSSWALGMALAVGVFFTFLVAGVANPFEPVFPVPSDGPGPNPLLQNHILMVVHPPMLYLGYVGMSVPFAMGSAALLAGRLDASWMRYLRRWTLVPWAFLSIGIVLGGWWSYEVLGWGGWWAWDPVENASFLPWLTATAFLHSAMVMERRDQLKGWTLSLLMGTFLLTVLGTFMTRSGVFNSVHSFTQSSIGPTFLTFLAFCLIFSVVLLAARVDRLEPVRDGLPGPISRELAFLGNNLLFSALAFTVLLGTVYPLVNEALTGRQISVGEPYFKTMVAPIGLALVFLMGVGPALPWGRWTLKEAWKQLQAPVIIGLAVTGGSAAAGIRGFWPLATFGTTGFAVAVTVRELWLPGRARAHKVGEALPIALLRANLRARRRFGGYIVHLGVFMVVIANLAGSAYRRETNLTIPDGGTRQFEGYSLTYTGAAWKNEPHRKSQVARFDVSRDGKRIGTLEPRLNQYKTMRQPIGTPVVHSTPMEDLYLSLVQVDPTAGTVSVDVIVQPLVWWLWFGGGVIVLGALIAGWPRRAGGAGGTSAKVAIRRQPEGQGGGR